MELYLENENIFKHFLRMDELLFRKVLETKGSWIEKKKHFGGAPLNLNHILLSPSDA